MAKRYGEALPPLQQALAIDPDFFPTHTALGLLDQQTYKPDAAIEEYRKAYRLSGGNILQLANQGFVLGQSGRRAEAQQIIATLQQISQGVCSAFYLCSGLHGFGRSRCSIPVAGEGLRSARHRPGVSPRRSQMGFSPFR